MTLERYQQHRRAWEVGLWVAFFLVNFLAQVGVVWVEFGRRQLEFQRWEAVVWEGSSILVQLVVLLPLILWFDRRFPLARPDLARNARAHLMFTVPFSILHVLGMVGLREIAYGVAGGNYDFGNWPVELGYEYLKDFRSYGMYIGIIYLYRFILRRAQGEAGFLSEGREEQEAEAVVDRFLVKKLGREFLVKVEDIDWIQASETTSTCRWASVPIRCARPWRVSKCDCCHRVSCGCIAPPL